MSTHRTPHGSIPHRSGGDADRPAAGASRPGGRTSGHAPPHDRAAARASRPGKGGPAAVRTADAAVVTGRDKRGPDQPRTGPDKKARVRAQAGQPGRGVAQPVARGADRGPAAAARGTVTPLREDSGTAREGRAGGAPIGRMAPRGSGAGDASVRTPGPRGAGAREARSVGDVREDRPARPGRTAPASAFPAPQRRSAGVDAPPRRDAAGRPSAEPEAEEHRARAGAAKGIWLYGSHAVAAALANPERHLRRLLLTEEAEALMRRRMAGAWPLTPERIDRARLDQLLGRDAVHGGVALLADPLASPSLAEALARPGPVLVLDQVSDPRNVGAILRSAASFGACAVVVQDRNAPDETGVMAKAASGALERMPLLRAVNLARTLGALKAAGLWVVGLDTAGGPLSGPALAERRVALVLGAEGAGLRRLTRETCDELAGLPMPGGMESLNVSAAAAVALYELTHAPASSA